jgi:hypothetical protein
VPLAGIYLLAAVGALIALLAPLEIGFAAVLGAWMLLPAGLILPGLFHVLLVDRIILGAFVLRLIVRYGRPGEPEASAYRPTALHAAWAALLFVGYLDGAVLASGELHDNLTVWLTLFDCVVLLVAALAVLRTIGLWRFLRPVTVVIGLAITVGIIERLTGRGWAAYLSEHVPAAYQSTFIFNLATRGGSVRAQGASEFALEYGWVLAILLPVLMIAAGLWIDRNHSWGPRRHLLLLLPVGAALGVLLSASRSAEIAVAAGAVLLVITAGAPRRITAAVGVAGVVVVAILAFAPSVVLHPFRAAANSNSIESRLVRLKVLFGLVDHHAFAGLGYTGFHNVLIGLDNAYATTYGQLGVLGLLAWVGVIVTSLAVAVRTLRARRGSPVRQLGAACAVGVVAVAVAAAGYDFTFTEQSMWTLVLLGVLATYLAEQLPARAPVRSPARVLLPVLGAAAGALVLALAPVSFGRSYSVYLMTPKELALQPAGLINWSANELASTVCGYLQAPPTVMGTSLTCTQPSVFETSSWPAQVTVSVAGGSPAAVRAESKRALQQFVDYGYPTVAANGPIESGKPAWATTAPVSGAFAGFMMALLVPSLRRRAVRARAPALAPA